jgi:hypothetical protein
MVLANGTRRTNYFFALQPHDDIPGCHTVDDLPEGYAVAELGFSHHQETPFAPPVLTKKPSASAP